MSSLARPTITLLSGTVVAQLIALGASPILARLFGPQDFAALALYTALLGALSVIAGGRYELAILLPSDDEQAINLTVLSILLALAFALALSGLLYWAHAALLDLLGWKAGGGWFGLLPSACLFSVGLAAWGGWANRKGHFRLISIHRILQGLAVVLASFSLGFFGKADDGLVWGSFLGLVLAFTSFTWFAWPELASRLRAITLRSLKQVAKQYGDFPRLNLPHALLDNLQSVVLLSAIGAIWGAATLGFYVFAIRVLRAPFAMVGAAMGQVFQQQFANAFNDERPLRPLMVSLLRKQLPCLLLLVFAGCMSPGLFALVFGDAWGEAAEMAQTLLPWMALSFLVSPFAQIPQVLGRQGAALIWGVAYQTSMLAPLVVAWLLDWRAGQGLLLQSLCASLLLGVYGIWLWGLTWPGRFVERH